MKIKKTFVPLIFLFGLQISLAQDKKLVTLKEAVELAVNNSNQALLANTKVTTSMLEVATTKNNQYPSLKISGQYLRLTNATINSKISTGNSSSTPSKVDQLLLGQANVAVPLFNGFKLKNSISISENLYHSEIFSAAHTKEQVALQVVDLFASLYKAQQMTTLIEENLKSAQQRVKDFTAMEANGLMARNDLLKAQLQVSNIELSLENAKKNVSVVNYQLITLLKLPETTEIEIDIEAVKKEMLLNQNTAIIGKRNDLQALQLKKVASEKGIQIAKGNYYPSLNLVGGYIALDFNNLLSVTNAINYGVGVSYDLASIFKNKKEVTLASNKAKETQQAVAILSDEIKEEIHQAQENYNLSLKQSSVYDKAVEQTTENFRIVTDKYNNSLSTTNDLLEADVEQLQSKINQALSKADIAQKYYELQYASGKLIQSLNIKTN